MSYSEEFMKMFVEDIKKYGFIDEYGNIWMDSGLQKQRVGKVKLDH